MSLRAIQSAANTTYTTTLRFCTENEKELKALAIIGTIGLVVAAVFTSFYQPTSRAGQVFWMTVATTTSVYIYNFANKILKQNSNPVASFLEQNRSNLGTSEVTFQGEQPSKSHDV